jgi:hypothetical protein
MTLQVISRQPRYIFCASFTSRLLALNPLSQAFHGNHVSVYTKSADDPPNTLAGVQWTRHVIENFGPLNEQHTGSIHEVVCADIDGDGVDETLVALMGSDPPSWDKTGVWCYKRTRQ